MSKRRPRATEYNSWRTMRQRCCNPKSDSYWMYGARGITICDRWMASYANFLADMGPKPTPGYSLERVDNNAGYSPENCIWATWSQQAANTRQCHYIVVNGVKDTITGWARKLGCMTNTLRSRLRCGWTEEEAVTTPVNKKYQGYTKEKRAGRLLPVGVR